MRAVSWELKKEYSLRWDRPLHYAVIGYARRILAAGLSNREGTRRQTRTFSRSGGLIMGSRKRRCANEEWVKKTLFKELYCKQAVEWDWSQKAYETKDFVLLFYDHIACCYVDVNDLTERKKQWWHRREKNRWSEKLE